MEKIKACDKNDDFGEHTQEKVFSTTKYALRIKTTDINLNPRLICYIIRMKENQQKITNCQTELMTQSHEREKINEKSFVRLSDMCQWIFLSW